LRQASSSSSNSLVARLTSEDDRLSMPNWRITASASRVETPLMYNLSHCQHHRAHRAAATLQRLQVKGFALMPGTLGHLHRNPVPAGVSIRLGLEPLV